MPVQLGLLRSMKSGKKGLRIQIFNKIRLIWFDGCYTMKTASIHNFCLWVLPTLTSASLGCT